MDNRPLKIKALEAAINQLKRAKTREEANKVYKTWEVFHNNAEFIMAIQAKVYQFEKQENNGKIHRESRQNARTPKKVLQGKKQYNPSRM